MKMKNRALVLTTLTVGIVTGLILSGLAVNAVEKDGVASERESFLGSRPYTLRQIDWLVSHTGSMLTEEEKTVRRINTNYYTYRLKVGDRAMRQDPRQIAKSGLRYDANTVVIEWEYLGYGVNSETGKSPKRSGDQKHHQRLANIRSVIEVEAKDFGWQDWVKIVVQQKYDNIPQ